jgi:tetratricopeptide (TPR) repeat protein
MKTAKDIGPEHRGQTQGTREPPRRCARGPAEAEIRNPKSETRNKSKSGEIGKCKTPRSEDLLAGRERFEREFARPKSFGSLQFSRLCGLSVRWTWWRLLGVAASAALFFCPGVAFGSPSSALRKYKDGKFDEALKEYQQMLERKADDPRLHFNAGTAAYRNGQFTEATNQFSAALNSPDLKLQESAYYNRGNALYRLGEKSAEPGKRAQAWERAVRDYDLSLKLDANDEDARFNRDFVTKKLEELKKQQSQNNQQKNIEPSEAAKKAKAEADQAISRREYPRALEIMTKQLEQDPTTAYYNDFIQRLKEVNGVQESAKL